METFKKEGDLIEPGDEMKDDVITEWRPVPENWYGKQIPKKDVNSTFTRLNTIIRKSVE